MRILDRFSAPNPAAGGGGEPSREYLLARARRLEYLTIAWNLLEALGAVAAGLLAGSIALIGFGFDSCIEVASGATVLWRLRDERRERLALRLVGVSFFLLSAYLAADSIHKLLAREAPEESIFGIVVTAVSLVAMPLLARAKRRVAGQLNSSAMHADSRQTDICAWLSAVTLAGLLLNALLGWWWADPAAALLMIPLIFHEGLEAVRGKTCCECVSCDTNIPSS